MNKASSAIEGSQGNMFLRNATGLLREVSVLDAFIMNTFGMNIAVGAVFLFLQAPANFPQGNMLVAVIIGTLLMAFTLLWVYSTFAAAMPRSGGDYVFVSRFEQQPPGILPYPRHYHPVVGYYHRPAHQCRICRTVDPGRAEFLALAKGVLSLRRRQRCTGFPAPAV